MPYVKQSTPNKPTAAEQFQREGLAKLVQRYEAVRSIHGRDRDVAARELGIALARYGQTFVHGEYAWSWSWVDDSITRQKMFKFHAENANKTKHGKETTPCDL